jgi:putative surface cell wall-binding protein
MSFLTSRAARVAAGLAVVSAFAVAPIAAQAADTTATGTLTGGSLTNTAPAITPFSATLSGVNQTANSAVGGWSVTDATGTNAGYSVTVSATAPTVGGEAAGAGTGGTITLTPTTATAAAGNPAATGPVAGSAQLLSTTAATIDNAEATTGQGEWDFAADTGTTKNLAVVIPGDASAGTYSSTLTFTTAPPVV